jgi:hypothetical protein
MNTKNKQDQKNQRQNIRHEPGPKKRGQNTNLLHDRKHEDQEQPETRMTR